MTAHQINYGEDCLACHDGLDSMDSFNHNIETDFPLLGAHLLITCSDCHEPGSFQNLSADCAACHQEPAQHVGLFEQNCASCHTLDAWSPATFGETNFSHQDSTRFSLVHHALDFSGSPMTCASCHQGEGWRSPPQICLDCHIEQEPIEINQHFSEFGPRCLDCHDGRDRMQNFDHGSYFLLEGKHADVTCDICHQEQVWVDTNPTCISCHEEPELHLGVFGQQCQYCHVSEGWVPAPLRRHPFPLEHGADTASTCETCHQEIYSAYSCYSCHEHDQGEIESGHTAAGIGPDEVSSCFDCHKNGEIEESR
jgi:hypothetical protein